MGVFDESDEDNEEQQDTAVARDRARMATDGSASAFATWPGVQQDDVEVKQPRKDGDEQEEEEEDPLDAYMRSLEQQQQQQPSTHAALASAASLKKHQRLDLENEDHGHDDDDHDDGHDAFAKSAPNRLDERESQAQTPSSSSSSSSLTTWRKVFWTVQNTVQGRTWRANHDVACSVAVDPIYDFSNLIQKQEASQQDDGNHAQPPFFYANETFIDQTFYKLGFQQPTIVQSQTMPVVLSGMDVLVTAATGQGKTLAYAWPMMIHVLDQPALSSSQSSSSSSSSGQTQNQNETGPIALILVPTRELALQVNKQVEVLFKAAAVATSAAKTSLLTTRAVIGGVGKYILYQQLKKSGGVHVVVATPGRLIDVLSLSDSSCTTIKNKGGLSLQRVTMLILDEMDKMLAMGFVTQVRQILSALPKQNQQQQPSRQTLMFSATLGRRVENVAKEWLSSSYVRIAVGQVGECSTSVRQHVMVLPNEQAKQSFIIAMLPTLQDVGRTLIFCATRQGCEHLANVILQSNDHNNDNNNFSDNNNTDSTSSSGCIGAQNEGEGEGEGVGVGVGGRVVKLEVIHGERHQSDRVKALKAFTQGRVNVLIATDVAGRGLDVPNVATVINFDPAKNMDSHVHRIGRAGRISKQINKKASISNGNNSTDAGDDDNDNDTACANQQQQPQEGTAYTLLTPRNVDFALALRNALSRQGRPISQDLNDLANQSRKVANGNRSKNSRESSSAAYYAPSQPRSESASPQKRSRWA